MDPKIITKGEMILVGVVSDDKAASSNYPDICELWKRFGENGKGIEHKVDGASYELHRFLKDGVEVTVAFEVSRLGAVPDGMTVTRLPARQYAVFTHRLADGGYEGLNPVMDEWLKTGPYEHADNSIIELYDERFKGGDQPDSEIDFWIPVKPRS